MNQPSETVVDQPTAGDADIEAKLSAALDLLRPAIQADGGDIILKSFEDGVVTVELAGACGGCPLSTDTMKAGVERIIKDKVPEVGEVVAI